MTMAVTRSNRGSSRQYGPRVIEAERVLCLVLSHYLYTSLNTSHECLARPSCLGYIHRTDSCLTGRGQPYFVPAVCPRRKDASGDDDRGSSWLCIIGHLLFFCLFLVSPVPRSRWGKVMDVGVSTLLDKQDKINIFLLLSRKLALLISKVYSQMHHVSVGRGKWKIDEKGLF
jgi:hypothetical protein